MIIGDVASEKSAYIARFPFVVTVKTLYSNIMNGLL